MEKYINFKLKTYTKLYNKPVQVLEHLFAVLGNGESLNSRGFLSYEDSEPFRFGSPIALTKIYPYYASHSVPLQYLGCRDKGFKDAVQYFIDCIKLTPNSVKDIKLWKELGIKDLEKLIDAPLIEDPFKSKDDVDLFLSQCDLKDITHNNYRNDPINNSVQKIWYFDVQWSDCPRDVEAEIKHIWRERGLGNDDYMYKAKLDDHLFKHYPRVYLWLKHKGVVEGEPVVIHWWW